jgi:hypothetical protein
MSSTWSSSWSSSWSGFERAEEDVYSEGRTEPVHDHDHDHDNVRPLPC